MRVVATAGHVDHGKSALVLALTGTDPDRFPEEKARGLTIDLGFAFCTLPSGTEVGFVDVPGHTRFIKNMLAGVGAVDVAMLVVAANEGWKPQSEEHLRILDLLDVRHGIVVITKTDLVDDETPELARLEIEEHLVGTTFEGLEIVTSSARRGEGIDDVRNALDRALAGAPGARDLDRPRLWIDRVFVARGAGTVVTGTLTGGGVGVDDELVVDGRGVRVRGIEQHGQPVARAAPGERVALNLAGIDHDRLARGDALVRARQWRRAAVVDVAVTELPGAALPRRGRLTAAVGSGDHRIWFRRLDDRFARLRFATAVPVAPGDRMILRDHGTGRTVAGAEVLDVEPAGRTADAPGRLARPLGERLLAAGWLDRSELGPRTGAPPETAERVVRDAGGERVGRWLVDHDEAERARAAVRHAVAVHHASDPTSVGLPVAALARSLQLDPERTEALLVTLPDLEVTDAQVHRVEHVADAAGSDAGRALVNRLEREGLAPAPPEDPGLARRLVREGVLVQIGDRYFATSAVRAARERIVAALAERGTLTVAEARDLLGSTRRFVVPLLAHFDATGITRRRGDDRIPGPRSGLAPD